MSRWEFMRQLEELLSDISPSEREEALQYYNDYFNDAGKENEGQVIESLGTPAQVAQIVKEGLAGNGSAGEFTENGYKGKETENRNAVAKRTQPANESERQENSQSGTSEQAASGAAAGAAGEKKEMPTWAIVLIVIACVLFSPAIIGLAGAVFALIISVFIAVISLVFALGLTTLILLAVAIILLVAGISCLFVHPISALALFGSGCLCGALGILFMLITVFLVGKCIPGICQGISYIFRKLFGKKEGNKA